MNCITRGFIAHVGMWCILAMTTVTAFAEIPITSCPFTINAPGNYILTADLTCGDGGITITASDVSLKLNGHKITVPSQPQGVVAISVGSVPFGFSTPVDHVGIQGPGLITSPSSQQSGLFIGIYLQSASYSQVSQVTIMQASLIEGGIEAFNCNFLTLASNVVGRSGAGVTLLNTNSSSVTGNDTSGNVHGISLFIGSGNTVSNNVANGNSTDGISVESNRGARVYGNVTNGNGSYGISNIFTITQAFNNSSKGNGIFDLFDQDACDGSWSDNVFLTANAPCIH